MTGPLATAPADAAPVVRVAGLTVSYRARQRSVPAVRGLDLAIGLGESYGLVGESGSGKSTAAMALTRYLPAGTEISAAELSVGQTTQGRWRNSSAEAWCGPLRSVPAMGWLPTNRSSTPTRASTSC